MPETCVADDIFRYLFYLFFIENKTFRFACLARESPEMSSLNFSVKKKIKQFRMSSATIVIGSLTVKYRLVTADRSIFMLSRLWGNSTDDTVMIFVFNSCKFSH